MSQWILQCHRLQIVPVYVKSGHFSKKIELAMAFINMMPSAPSGDIRHEWCVLFVTRLAGNSIVKIFTRAGRW